MAKGLVVGEKVIVDVWFSYWGVVNWCEGSAGGGV